MNILKEVGVLPFKHWWRDFSTSEIICLISYCVTDSLFSFIFVLFRLQQDSNLECWNKR